MKELQSLGLNMELLKENDEEIIIKESTEDDEDNIIKTREGLSETPEQGEEDDYSNEVIEQEDEFAGDFEEIFENEGGMEIVDQEDLDM